MTTTPFEAEMKEIEQTINQVAAASTFSKWLRDQKKAPDLGGREARFLVDTYYTIQEGRKSTTNQLRAMRQSEEPVALIDWLGEQDKRLEVFIQGALAYYIDKHKMGLWLRGVYGIGPVLAAGLVAYIDIHKCPTVGHIWQFCGIAGSGQKKWNKGEKRPWAAMAKTLTYKIGDSFIKFSNQPDCIYGKMYRDRKAYEIKNNDAGRYAEQATREAAMSDKSTEKWPWNNACYPAGTTAAALAIDNQDERNKYLKSVRSEPGSGLAMLHLGHINDRARRYATKQFLADFHDAWYRTEFGREPPLPYPVAHMGHVHARSAAE